MRLFVERAADHMGADGEAVLGSVMLSDPVTRLEMAQLMFGLVDDISADVRISPLDGQIESYNHDTNSWDVVNDFFADVKFLEPIRESQIVGATYELGITKGRSADVSTPDSVFAPSDPVSRAEMAAFIARTLDHSNLRPEGLAIQRNGNGDTMVSLRDADFAPVGEAYIDVFSALYPDDAFDEDDGECVLRFVRDETPSFSACAIDVGDQQTTDDDGNIEFTLASDDDPIAVTCGTDSYTFTSAAGSEGRTFWAWTGDLGDDVNEDTTLAGLEDVDRPVGTSGPDYARISGGLPTDDELAKMGETVTFTLQLHSDTGANGRDEAVLIDDVTAGTDRSRNPYLLRIEKYLVIREAVSVGTNIATDPTDWVPTDSDYGDLETETKDGSASADGFSVLPGNWNYGVTPAEGAGTTTAANARIQTPFDTVVFPNADGELTIDLTHADLNVASGMNDPDVGVKFTVRPFMPGNDFLAANLLSDADDMVVSDETHHAATGLVQIAPGVSVPGVTGYVIFSDDPSDPHSVSAESADYRIIGGSQTGNSVTVTVLDQYGDGMRNVDVSVDSTLDMAVPANDEASYPEQVDITLGATENADGDTTAAPVGTGSGGPGETELLTLTGSSYRTADAEAAVIAASAALIQRPDVTSGTEAATATRTVTLALRVDADGTVAQVQEDETFGSLRTRRNGAYRIGYAYTGSDAKTETITPQSVQVTTLTVTSNDGTAATVTAAPAVAAEIGEQVMVRWTDLGTTSRDDSGATPDTGVPVLVRDVASRTIVVDEAATPGTDPEAPHAYFYDEDDTFIINDGSVNVGATFEMFEEALSLKNTPDGCQVNGVTWDNYTLRANRTPGARPARVDRTVWQVFITGS